VPVKIASPLPLAAVPALCSTLLSHPAPDGAALMAL
jgi:hypothetical protein